MPFGLRNAPAIFQRALDVILSSVICKSALEYSDDIMVFSKTVKDDMAHLRPALSLLRDYAVILKLEKMFASIGEN